MKSLKTTEQFNDTIQNGQPVIVKFQAGWCPDCTRMDMFIDPIIEQYDNYQWFDVNRDELPEIAEQYEVMGIPSLLIFKDGEKLAHLHSAHAKTPDSVIHFLEEQNA
ncbi:thiol reductase thioredoxin [Planococcus plakortidis]|uniref:Thiol reductase thioredoxin n=1 Tax=Planococcus plakortidis TaxID=1038856 RepID=A0A1C7E5G0_9BACL|nr:thioredoxin family protein [Planococcus plakortidis]ANU18979.1 thiol reductase thioredoxin [Planococcus plakortidis]